jgi:hypothetical protein
MSQDDEPKIEFNCDASARCGLVYDLYIEDLRQHERTETMVAVAKLHLLSRSIAPEIAKSFSGFNKMRYLARSWARRGGLTVKNGYILGGGGEQ